MSDRRTAGGARLTSRFRNYPRDRFSRKCCPRKAPADNVGFLGNPDRIRLAADTSGVVRKGREIVRAETRIDPKSSPPKRLIKAGNRSRRAYKLGEGVCTFFRLLAGGCLRAFVIHKSTGRL